MKEYKTLKGLLKQTSYKQISFSDILEGRFFNKSKNKYIDFCLSETAKKDFCNIAAKYCFSTKKLNKK